jgi:exocyst complex component 2
MVDSKNLHFLEDWQPIANQKGTTRYLELMNTFQLRILTSSRKIGTKIEKEREREREILPSNHRKKIKESFVESLCFLFDGILNGAMASPQLNNRRPSRVSASRVLTVRDIVRLSLPLLLFFLLHTTSSPFLLGSTPSPATTFIINNPSTSSADEILKLTLRKRDY